MKKTIYVLILSLVAVSGLVFTFASFVYGSDATGESKTQTKFFPKPLSIAEKKARMDGKKKWDASPDGIKYKQWEDSPEGQKVLGSYDKIKKQIKDFSDMEAVVTSVTFTRSNAKSPKWLIVRINGEQYMMQFIPKEFQLLQDLKVNDKIIVRSRGAGNSPNHPYLILSGDYIAQNNKVLFKRDLSKNKGC